MFKVNNKDTRLLRLFIQATLLCNFIEITLRHGCSPVNLLYIFRTPFTMNTGLTLTEQYLTFSG